MDQKKESIHEAEDRHTSEVTHSLAFCLDWVQGAEEMVYGGGEKELCYIKLSTGEGSLRSNVYVGIKSTF